MKTIINPITKKGKVKCIHYYEKCHTRWYDTFMCIFIHEEKIYFFRVDDPKKLKETIICFGDIEPHNMSKAINTFKNNI